MENYQINWESLSSSDSDHKKLEERASSLLLERYFSSLL